MPEPSPNRDLRLDFFRGLALFLISRRMTEAVCDSGVPRSRCHRIIPDSSLLVEAKDIMKARIDLMHVTPGVIQAMLGLERQTTRQSGRAARDIRNAPTSAGK